MNPLTQVKNTQKITAREAALGISEEASWHARYKDSAYIYVGNFSFELTEGDLLAIFAQYGEIVDINLLRDKATGKSRGFAFIAYEDQRSTVLAVDFSETLMDWSRICCKPAAKRPGKMHVQPTECLGGYEHLLTKACTALIDNLNGASVVGRVLKVDHVANYKRKVEEDEEEQQRKREERGVCYAFQRGECSRGSSCKFSHDEKRSADTGWGPRDKEPRWDHDKYKAPSKKRDEVADIRESKGKLEARRETTLRSSADRREYTRYSLKEDTWYSSNEDAWYNRNGGGTCWSGREITGHYKDDEKLQSSKSSYDRSHGRQREDVKEIPKNENRRVFGDRFREDGKFRDQRSEKRP